VLHSLDHVLLAVRDLPAATRQYARLLGRAPSWRGLHPSAGTANSLFRLENTYLELLAPEGSGPHGSAVRKWLEDQGEGPLGLAFGSDDADACRAELAERGLAPEPVEKGLGRDEESGAFREWRRVPLPLSATRGVLVFAIEHLSPDAVLPLARPLGEAGACVFALDHAVIRTADAEATRALYGEGLGLRLALDRRFEQWGARLLFFRVGGLTVEVAAELGTQTEPGAPDRLWGLSYRVAAADAARSRLAELGFDVSEVREGRKPGTRVFSVRDGTCGVPTLFLEPQAAVPEGR
jgi:catechol 2,3-dioxygenase-like lactoylglutathione lyase family enzyme